MISYFPIFSLDNCFQMMSIMLAHLKKPLFLPRPSLYDRIKVTRRRAALKQAQDKIAPKKVKRKSKIAKEAENAAQKPNNENDVIMADHTKSPRIDSESNQLRNISPEQHDKKGKNTTTNTGNKSENSTKGCENGTSDAETTCKNVENATKEPETITKESEITTSVPETTEPEVNTTESQDSTEFPEDTTELASMTPVADRLPAPEPFACVACAFAADSFLELKQGKFESRQIFLQHKLNHLKFFLSVMAYWSGFNISQPTACRQGPPQPRWGSVHQVPFLLLHQPGISCLGIN